MTDQAGPTADEDGVTEDGVTEDGVNELDEERLPFTEHLRELRTRTIRVTAYVLVSFVVAWTLRIDIFNWVTAPYESAILGSDDVRFPDLSYISLLEPIVVYLKASLTCAVLISAPMVLTEAWLFIAPGLYKTEKRLAAPFLFFSIFCFVGGVLFCRYTVMQLAIDVLLQFAGDPASGIITMKEYFDFALRLFLVFGVFFELPVVISFAAVLGLVTHKTLIKHWRFAVIGSVIVGAMLTPPDPITQLALAVPMVALYAISIVLAFFITKAKSPGKA
ncbi:MAG: sec-independent protein translocase protein TatC [Bradymonadia bacterium]